MITVYRVLLQDGSARSVSTLDELVALRSEHGEIRVDVDVRYTPCPEHRAYEAASCPQCGTSKSMSPKTS